MVRIKPTERLPAAVDGIQINCCRNPLCRNFNVPASPTTVRGRARAEDRDTYRVVGQRLTAEDDRNKYLQCKLCNESFRLKSNLAIVEETRRLLKTLQYKQTPSCKVPNCASKTQPIADGQSPYVSFGTTKAGSPRYRCKVCGSTFSVPARRNLKQRIPGKTSVIFRMLVNKVPMRRMCELADVHPDVLYERIGFLDRQCRAVAAHYESEILPTLAIAQMRLQVDRQDHILNWISSLDRRNVVLRAVTSVDGASGYVVAQNLNFDPDTNAQEVLIEARRRGEHLMYEAFRTSARIRLPGPEFARTPVDDELPVPGRPPPFGAQVHEEYTVFAHFRCLKHLLRGVQHFHFSLDREPNIRAACLLTFADEVRAGRVDPFFVRINKDLTVSERNTALGRSSAVIDAFREEHPGLTLREAILSLIQARYASAVGRIDRHQDRWVEHPLPTMNEPEKYMVYLGNPDIRSPEALAAAFSMARMRDIDRYFMQTRRRINLLERPIHSASSAGRVWSGYSAYQPRVVERVLNILRCVYNFALVGQDGQTPAQRLGVTTRAWSFDEIEKFI